MRHNISLLVSDKLFKTILNILSLYSSNDFKFKYSNFSSLLRKHKFTIKSSFDLKITIKQNISKKNCHLFNAHFMKNKIYEMNKKKISRNHVSTQIE